MTQTRKAKGRADLVHLLRQVHRTEIRKVTEAQKAHRNLLVKVSQGKKTDYLVQTSRKEVAKREIHVIIGMFPNVQNINLQQDANSETSVHTNTLLNLLMEKSAFVAIHIPLNDERQMQLRKNQSDDKTQVRVRFHHLANKSIWKWKNWGLRLESCRQDPKISEIQTPQHSRKDRSNGP